MPRRHHVQKVSYIEHRHASRHGQLNQLSNDFQNYLKIARKYLRKAYSKINESYWTVFTILFVVILSFLLPDISNKIHRTKELKAMKNTLDVMANEVNRAEVACLAVADKVCYLQCSMQDDHTETTRDIQDLSVYTSNSLQDTQSEPVQVEKKIGFFRRIFFPRRHASRKEVAIMSFLYSDSFTAQKTLNDTDVPLNHLL